MVTKLIMACSVSATLLSCNGQNTNTINYATVEPLHINRFDKDLFRLIDTEDTTLQPELIKQYPEMLDIIGKGILNLQTIETPGFFEKMRNYYSEPTLKGLYRDAITQYDSVEDIEKSLGYGFAYLKENFPSMQIPAIYMHVSGFNQNVLVGDSLLSLSIDKYMGKDYPLYQDFFYDSQKLKMQRGLVVPDYLAGWLMSEYPFAGKENVLLDRMIYEGKIKYLLSQALGVPDAAELMGYTEQAYNWCKDNEGTIWKAIIERKHLYTPDQLITSQYFEDTPAIFPENDAPENIGTWIGWQIINQYMKETGSTPEALMQNNDAQEILTASKYKPL